MAQQSVKARNRPIIIPTGSEEVLVSESRQRSGAGRHKNLTYSPRHQQHHKSVELPPPHISKVKPIQKQPDFQIKALEETERVRQTRLTQHNYNVKTGSTVQDRQSEHLKRPRRKTSPLVYALRLLILGVGIGAIAGTLLSVLEPTSRLAANHSPRTSVEKTQQEKISGAAVVPTSALKLSQETIPLKTTVQQLAAKKANLMPGIFLTELDSGSYLDLNGSLTFSAASMIKFPILVAFFQDVDAGKVSLDEILTLKQQLIGGGSGDIQYRRLGTKFTALETIEKMITISDNTATNMVIDRLGGAAVLNQRFQNWGLMATQIRNPLPDLTGTNTTSPKDLANLMAFVDQGDLVSTRSRDRLLDIMQRTKTNTLLTPGLGKGATIAHKTGDIGSLVGDVGLVDMPNGKRYIAVAMVKRPHNDSRAQELIRAISRAAYQEFNKPVTTEARSTTPFTRTGQTLENPISVNRRE